MKRSAKVITVLAVLLLISASYCVGSYMRGQDNIKDRQQRCNTFITFAINKADTEDLKDQDMMEALISNIYAAYQYCDKPALAAQLHDLWNTLIFNGETYIGKEDFLVDTLKNIALAIRTEE